LQVLSEEEEERIRKQGIKEAAIAANKASTVLHTVVRKSLLMPGIGPIILFSINCIVSLFINYVDVSTLLCGRVYSELLFSGGVYGIRL